MIFGDGNLEGSTAFANVISFPNGHPLAAKAKTLDDLFHETLKDIYFAEIQILKALPKMAKAVNSDHLRNAFETHRDETEGKVDRLEEIFKAIGKPARGKTCDAILGIADEGKVVMEDFDDSSGSRCWAPRRGAGGRAL